MILIVGLDVFFFILGMFVILGFGGSLTLVAWMLENALAVGIILLILHIGFTVPRMVSAYSDYSIIGALCVAVHAVFPPLVILAAYQATVETGKELGMGIVLQWWLVFACLSGTNFLSQKALETSKGSSYLRLLVLTVLNVIISIFLVISIRQEGF